MEYFKSSFKSVLGAPRTEEQTSYADTVSFGCFEYIITFV